MPLLAQALQEGAMKRGFRPMEGEIADSLQDYLEVVDHHEEVAIDVVFDAAFVLAPVVSEDSDDIAAAGYLVNPVDHRRVECRRFCDEDFFAHDSFPPSREAIGDRNIVRKAAQEDSTKGSLKQFCAGWTAQSTAHENVCSASCSISGMAVNLRAVA